MKLCRACLSSNTDLFPFDDLFVCNYNLLTNLNVKPFDGKSQYFCQTCMDAVNFFIEFRNKCVSADSNLQESCSQQIIKAEKQDCEVEIHIKGEIKYEDAEVSSDMQYEYQANQDSDGDDKFQIKTEEGYGIKVKKTKKQSKKHKPSKKKDKLSLKTTIPKENYKKLITDKPACGLCGIIFDDITTLNKHLEGHQTDSSCRLCYYQTFEHWPQLLAHRLLHTVKYNSCHMCDKKFKSHFSLEHHYWKVHCGEHDVKLACRQCSGKYSTPRKLTKHIRAVHSHKSYICDICSKVYSNKQSLKSHIISHGMVKIYACHLCGYKSKYAGGLAAHKIRRHAPNKCICRKCERAFANPDKMAKHVCIDKSKICPVCGKSFQRGFTRHLATHGDEKIFKCPRCPTAYRSRSALKVHVDKHDNNPTQQCEHCLRRFYSPSVLIKHRRVHTGEKPYACKRCDMRFTGNHNLKVHMKVHGEMLFIKKDAADDV